MTKKATQTFLLVFSTLLLLVPVTVSAQGQPPQDRLRGNSPVFTGEWKTVTNKGIRLLIKLEQNRHNIVTGSYNVNGLTGSYKPSDSSIHGLVNVSWRAEPALQSLSSITGTVKDNVLRFTWTQDDRRHGAGRITLSSDGESFEGTYSLTENPDDTSGGTWKGTRQHSFAGAWQGTVGGGGLLLILQQSGQVVTGQVKVNSADLGVIREGIVVGNTLRFKIVRPSRPLTNGGTLPEEFVGIGELVMNIGVRSFRGTVLNAAANGTLLGR
jgi:hypothetical protein